MLKALNCTQGERYLELAEKREANESFVYGWLEERVRYDASALDPQNAT